MQWQVMRLGDQRTNSQPFADHLSTAGDSGFGALDMTLRLSVRRASIAAGVASEMYNSVSVAGKETRTVPPCASERDAHCSPRRSLLVSKTLPEIDPILPGVTGLATSPDARSPFCEDQA